MRNRLEHFLQMAMLLMPTCMFYGQGKGTFTLPGSILLFNSDEHYIRQGIKMFAVQKPLGSLGSGDGLPALSLVGDRVAWSLVIPDNSAYMNHKSVLGVFSLLDKSWKLYGDFCSGEIGSVTFSPDGTKVGFTAIPDSHITRCYNQPEVLEILDLTTGKISTISFSGKVWMNSNISWSSDGKYLVGQIGGWTYPTQQIVVIDIETGRGTVIAEGMNPTWSPKGDWISYIDKTRQKCLLIHPDGTGVKIVLDLNLRRGLFYREFEYGVVWSPDGRRLLFNEAHGILESKYDVSMLDLETGKVTIKSKNGPAVFGWARISSERMGGREPL